MSLQGVSSPPTRPAAALGAAWLGLAACAVMGACSGAPDPGGPSTEQPAPPPVYLTRIDVDDRTPTELRPVPLKHEALVKVLETAFDDAGFEIGPEAPPNAWRVSVTAMVAYGVTNGQGIASAPVQGSTLATWEVEVKLRAPGEPTGVPVQLGAQERADFAGDATKLPAELDARLATAARTVARDAKATVDIYARPVGELIATLTSADPRLRRAAATRLAMMREKSAVPVLAARVREEPDRETQLGMIGALAEIGDDRATRALIDLANPGDLEQLSAILSALSVIGGANVMDFLGLLEGHDSQAVQRLAKEARERLVRTGKAGP